MVNNLICFLLTTVWHQVLRDSKTCIVMASLTVLKTMSPKKNHGFSPFLQVDIFGTHWSFYTLADPVGCRGCAAPLWVQILQFSCNIFWENLVKYWIGALLREILDPPRQYVVVNLYTAEFLS